MSQLAFFNVNGDPILRYYEKTSNKKQQLKKKMQEY